MLTLFSFNSVSDSIPSHYFFNTKNHAISWLNSGSAKLTDTISFYIVFLTTCAFNFLFKLETSHSYSNTKFESFFDKWFFLLVLYINNTFRYYRIKKT